MAISVLLVDDSAVMRKAIIGLLKGDPEIQVVAEASGLAQTMRLIGKLAPKIVVMDVHMGDTNEVKASEFRLSLNGSALLAISVWNDDETKVLADSYGAVQFLDKTNLGFELIPAIKRWAERSSWKG